MEHTPLIHSDYLEYAFKREKIDKFLRNASNLAKQYDFQAFAFRGMSGSLIAPLLAYKMRKSLLAVRKPKHCDAPESQSHSFLHVEGDEAASRYIIIDDFTSSGATVRAILEGISEFAPEAKCLGCIYFRGPMLYNEKVHLDYAGKIPDLCIKNPGEFKIKIEKKSKIVLDNAEPFL